MPRIFISYRRVDSEHIVGRIYDHLRREFGSTGVFKDVDSIPLGSDFREVIVRELAGCDVILAVIGPSWIGVLDEKGARRLENPDDYVRIEIEHGLERKIPVIPVLVASARMPPPDQLPSSLAKLVHHNGIPVRADPDFERDIDRLIRSISKPRRVFFGLKPLYWVGLAAVVAGLGIFAVWAGRFRPVPGPAEALNQAAFHATPILSVPVPVDPGQYTERLIAINESKQRAFVAGQEGNQWKIVEVDYAAGKVMRTLDVDRKITWITLTEDGSKLHAFLFGTNTSNVTQGAALLTLDTTTYLETARATLDGYYLLQGVCIGSQIYAARGGMAASLVTLAGGTMAPVREIPLGAGYPEGVQVSPDKQIVYIAALKTVYAVSIARGAVIETYPTNDDIKTFVVSRQKLHVLHKNQRISTVDLTTKDVKSDEGPYYAIALTGSDEGVLGVNSNLGQLAWADAATRTSKILLKLGGSPSSIMPDSLRERFFVFNNTDRTFSIVKVTQ